MFYSAVRYVYRRRDLIGRITQCFTQPLRCHQSLRFTCVVSQLRRPHKMWGWSLWRLTAGTELSYSTKFITEDEYNDLIIYKKNEFESDAEEYLKEDGRSVAEIIPKIISAYESGVSNGENDLDGVLRYMYAVRFTCLRDSPRYENVHLLQDDRLSSALQTILNKGLMKGSDPLQLNRLLVVGLTIQPSPEILQFHKKLERHMSQVWSRWHVKSRIEACHGWLHMSVLHEQKYFEEEIRFFLKHLMSEAKLELVVERKKLGGKEIHRLVSVLKCATHYSCALDGKWVDKNDVRQFLQELESNIEFSEPREVYRYVRLCYDVEYLVPSDNLWEVFDILLSDGTREYKTRAYFCIYWMLELARNQKLNKDFMYVHYVTKLAEVFKEHVSLLTLKDQIDITWYFSIMCYSDHEMLLKVVDNFVADAQNIKRDSDFRLVHAYLLMDCNPNIAFVKKLNDLIQIRGKSTPPFQLLAIAYDLMRHHGYHEVFSGILDSCFQSGLMKEKSLNVTEPEGCRRIVDLCGRLEIEQIDKYVKKIPPNLYKIRGVQDCAKKLKKNCRHHSKKDVLAAVQKNLGGLYLARITPVLPIYHSIVELCLNELNEPVDMTLVPRVFDENGFIKMENMSALPEGWRKIAVWFLRDEDLFINMEEELTGVAQAHKRFLHQAGYKEVLEVPFSMTKLESADLHKEVRDMLKKIPDIRLPKK